MSALQIGMKWTWGKETSLEVLDQDRLCYSILSKSNGGVGVRTISKKLLDEWIAAVKQHPNKKAEELREMLKGKSDVDRFEYGYSATLFHLAELAIKVESGYGTIEYKAKAVNEVKGFRPDVPLQQIFYGAPGTGKSYGVTKETELLAKEGRVVRTTFHPDSDYSTFVGAYKPTMEGEGENKKITYKFVAQSFLKAYVAAWRDLTRPEYLVIEEINRGNCAQIFGDLFQLLDRDEDGFSRYPIDADADLRRYLKGELNEIDVPEFGKIEFDSFDDVLSGTKLALPPNLIVRATMNTSDQSLFPIDSAFKRRWDWVYVPIKDEQKGWAIVIDESAYDWWAFVEKINDVIGKLTSSHDKQLGYFFVKADKYHEISESRFINKVLFYLWSDVFKDYEDGIKELRIKDGDSERTLSFTDFFGSKAGEYLAAFFKNLGLTSIPEWIREEESEELNEDNELPALSQKSKHWYSVNGHGSYILRDLALEVMKLFIAKNPGLSGKEIVVRWSALGKGLSTSQLLRTETDYSAYISDDPIGSTPYKKKAARYTPVTLSNGEKLYVSTQFTPEAAEKFKKRLSENGWPYAIDEVTK